MIKNGLRLLAFASALGAFAAMSQAQYLVNSTGSSIGTGDDSTYSYTLGGAFSFYGTNYTTVGVCTNGFLSITPVQTYTAFGNVAFPTANAANIAPFWDDLYVVNTGFSMNGVSTGTYDAFTWDAEHFAGNNGSHLQAQALLVRSNVTLQGFNFLAGDIAFSYGVLNGGTAGNSATIGVNAGNGTVSTVAPGTNDGAETGTGVPNFANTGQFFLFRYNANTGNYVGSLATVPEPASMSVLALGALALLRRRRK